MSTKDISQSLLGSDLDFVVFVHLAFDSASSRVHSSVGKLTWGGNDWFGMGDLGTVKMKETTDVRPAVATLTLSKVNQEYMNEALNEDTEGRAAEIYFGILGADGNIDGVPDLLLAGTMSAPTIDMETGRIGLDIEDYRSKLVLINGKKFNLEDHQEDATDDMFYEFVPKMLDWTFIFNGINIGRVNQTFPRRESLED